MLNYIGDVVIREEEARKVSKHAFLCGRGVPSSPRPYGCVQLSLRTWLTPRMQERGCRRQQAVLAWGAFKTRSSNATRSSPKRALGCKANQWMYHVILLVPDASSPGYDHPQKGVPDKDSIAFHQGVGCDRILREMQP